MSDSNRVGIRYIKEVTAGTTPSTPTLEVLPFTGSSDLGFTPETTTSSIIRSDRQISDLVQVNGSVAGGFDTELIAGTALDSLLQGVMFSAVTLASQSEVATITAASITVTDGAGNTVLAATGIGTGVVVGDVMKVEVGSETAFGVVSVATANSITIVGAMTASGSVTATVTILPSISNGVEQAYYTLERTYRTGESGVFYEYLRGMSPGTFSVSASASSIVESSFGFTGLTQEFNSQLSATRPAATTFTPYNAASNVATISIGGETLSSNFVMEANLEVENNLRERTALGTLGATSIGAGEFSVTGGINTYFNDSSLVAQVTTGTDTSLTIGFQSGDEEIIFILPRVKFTEGMADVSGSNEDVMCNLGFQALASSSLKTMYIAKNA
mgnify:CR=1 FL=1|tara:strand:- start:73 stop:1233 length:1161 start_codon:yes stop_codon:yes gene_type:complete